MHQHVIKLAVAIGAAAVMSSAASASSQPTASNSSQQNQVKHYKVAEGDNLSAIAQTQGLDSWRPLWDANPNITNPDLVYPGEDLVVPTGAVTDRPLPAGYDAATLDASYQADAAASPAPVVHHVAVYSDSSGVPGLLQRVKMRESGGNYADNTGNGYYGAYQFDLGTWRANAPAGYQNLLPSQAPPSVQDQAAQTLMSRRGCSPWPNTCY